MRILGLAAILLLLLNFPVHSQDAEPPRTAAAVASSVGRVALNLPGTGTDETAIDYAALPLLAGEHTVISATDPVWKFQLHNYLAHFGGKFWCIWSQGPPVEDEPTQHVRFATSTDGKTWSPPQMLTPAPAAEYAYIARGLWVRDGELLALAAHFKGKGAFGVNKELTLQAFVWDETAQAWKAKAKLFDNAINNFPPQKLPSGDWMMTRRDSRFNVSMLIGGAKALDDWKSFPVVERLQVKGFSPDEPIWWPLEDKRLVGLFRDNAGSSRLYRAFSSDEGRTWTLPALTNYPNSSSKIFSLQLSTGARVLIGNANPKLGRRELHLALSDDGVVFNRLARLDIPSPRPGTLQYPHAIEHEGRLLIVFSRLKNQSELLSVPLTEIAALQKAVE